MYHREAGAQVVPRVQMSTYVNVVWRLVETVRGAGSKPRPLGEGGYRSGSSGTVIFLRVRATCGSRTESVR